MSLFGYDTGNSTWRKLAADADGNLEVNINTASAIEVSNSVLDAITVDGSGFVSVNVENASVTVANSTLDALDLDGSNYLSVNVKNTVPVSFGADSRTFDTNSAVIGSYNIKSSAGTLHQVHVTYTGANTTMYVKLYNQSGTPTPATDTPRAIFTVHPNVPLHLDLGSVAFSTGIGYNVVAGAGDTDDTYPGSGECVATLVYA